MSDTVVKSNESILSLTNNSKSPPSHVDDESTSNNQYRSTCDTALSAIDKSDLQDRDDDDDDDDDGGGVEVEDLPPLPPLPPPSPDVS
jgi:hypothetical protein